MLNNQLTYSEGSGGLYAGGEFRLESRPEVNCRLHMPNIAPGSMVS